MNELLLKAIMSEHKDTHEQLAGALGIHPHTLYMKMRELPEGQKRQQFTQGEIRIIVDRYRLTPQDVMRIFFNVGVTV